MNNENNSEPTVIQPEPISTAPTPEVVAPEIQQVVQAPVPFEPVVEEVSPAPVEVVMPEQPKVASPPSADVVPPSPPVPAEPVAPVIPSQVETASEVNIDPSSVPEPPKVEKPKKKSRLVKKILLIFVALVIFGGSLFGSFMFGKSHEKIVIKAPELKPINLPPQAVVVNECVSERGKQYILPKDIPVGPIYDVVNSKVIAIEFNLVVSDLYSNPDLLSNTILELTRSYPVDHFSLVPVAPKAGDTTSYAHIVMYVVSKDDAKKITCPADTPAAVNPTKTP